MEPKSKEILEKEIIDQVFKKIISNEFGIKIENQNISAEDFIKSMDGNLFKKEIEKYYETISNCVKEVLICFENKKNNSDI